MATDQIKKQVKGKITDPVQKVLKDNESYLGWFRWNNLYSKRKMGILKDKNLKIMDEYKEDPSSIYEATFAVFRKCNDFYAKIINDCVFRKEEALALWEECKKADELYK